MFYTNYYAVLLSLSTEDYLAFSPEVVDFVGNTIIGNMGQISNIAFHVFFIVLGVFVAIKLLAWLSN